MRDLKITVMLLLAAAVAHAEGTTINFGIAKKQGKYVVTTTNKTDGPQPVTVTLTCGGATAIDITECNTNLLPGLSWVVDGKVGTLAKEPLVIDGKGQKKLELKHTDGTTYEAANVTALEKAGPPVDGESDCLAATEELANKILPYDASADRAEILVALNGNVITGDLSEVDEDDVVVVRTLVPKNRRQDLVVRRVSALRDRTVFRILGEGTTFRPESASTGCVDVPVLLSDFSPGRAQIDISMRSERGALEPIGSIEFVVNPLYRGTFTVGGVYTGLGESDFTFRTNATAQTVLNRGSSGRLVYALFFTPYVWGRRDVEKDGPLIDIARIRRGKPYDWARFARKFNPTVGMSLNSPLDNLFFGVATDLLEGIVLSAGGHVGRVWTVDPIFEHNFDMPLTVAAGDVPQRKDWRLGWYVSVSLDLRAAVKLLGAVFGFVAP